MGNKPDEILFTTEDGEQVTFCVIEQTRLGGVDYLLVTTTDEDEEEGDALDFQAFLHLFSSNHILQLI